ncbi:Rpn family recombination-promoting nuclease/putative transposase [Butyrivibrio sp. FCS006]|uniref:Rpn family recombination-promoting nuclease/putative transposase n=1 Tax=Butyrivibrio sp. FCS006 TaxID=1280684 RepID=UPI0006865D20|nr:Rpn family recombination-promoting nuclease/putative transposase [Butyrivibrio sp. FCS006]
MTISYLIFALQKQHTEAASIALIEHKASVDYNVVMQILRYMVYIWEDYEKQQEKLKRGISKTKKFMYPPVLPIVYYEGSKKWVASKMLSDRIALSEVFEEFIPDFKYYLISLNGYDKEELILKKDALSLVMLINRIKSDEDFKSLNLSPDYLDSLLEKTPADVLKIISRMIAVILRKKNVPEDEIQDLVDKIERKDHVGLFEEFKGFDVQAERKKGKEIGIDIGEELKLIKLVCKKLSMGQAPGQIAEDLVEDESHIRSICEIAASFAPDYDAEKIYDQLTNEKELV